MLLACAGIVFLIYNDCAGPIECIAKISSAYTDDPKAEAEAEAETEALVTGIFGAFIDTFVYDRPTGMYNQTCARLSGESLVSHAAPGPCDEISWGKLWDK